MKDKDKILGCILGGGIGDAFGGPFEGRPSPVIRGDEAWRLSDDTQLTLATCEAITRRGGLVDPAAVADAFVSWFRDSRVSGMGASTLKALTELLHGKHWALAGREGEMAAGNGAAMRIAPLAFCLDAGRPGDRQKIRDVSRITHRNEEAYVGALAVVAAINASQDGAWRGGDGLLDLIIELLPDSRVRDRLIILARLDGEPPLGEVAAKFGSSGYVVDSVPLALYGAQRVADLRFGGLLHELVAAGGDTDTVASIAGQVAGSLLGLSRLPAGMLARLPEKALCETIAHQFAETVLRAEKS
jgi:ADP-ribosylglycohydrolase